MCIFFLFSHSLSLSHLFFPSCSSINQSLCFKCERTNQTNSKWRDILQNRWSRLQKCQCHEWQKKTDHENRCKFKNMTSKCNVELSLNPVSWKTLWKIVMGLPGKFKSDIISTWNFCDHALWLHRRSLFSGGICWRTGGEMSRCLQLYLNRFSK